MTLFSNKINILIVDDNQAFLNLLDILLHDLGLTALNYAHHMDQALDLFHQKQIDICILDIELGEPGKTGIDLAERIRESNETVPIIFLTSNYTEDHYLKSREVRPSAFLSKEISKFKLQQAIDLALLHNNNTKSSPAAECNIPVISPHNFFFKIGDIYKSIPLDEVAYFFASQKLNYAKVGTRNYPTSVQLRTLERELSHHFLRIHKTYLVNVSLVESINPGENSIIINGETLPIGHAYRKHFLENVFLLK